MKALKELQEKRQSLLDDAQKIIDAAGDQMMSDEDAAAVKKAMDESDEIGNQIEALAKKASEQAELKVKLSNAKKAPDNADIRRIMNLGGLASGIHAGEDTARKFDLPRNVRRQPVANFKYAEDGMDPVVRAYRFGMWAMAGIGQCLPRFANQTAAATRYCLDNGLLNAAHGEGGSDGTGAHVFVPDEFGTDLILLREQFGLARRLFSVVNMSSDTKTEPRQLSGLTASFVAENSAGTESTMSFDNVTLVAKKLMALARISNELNMDAVISFGDKLAFEIGYAFASKEDDCAFNGTGASTFGGMVGLLTRLDELTAGTAPGHILGDGNAYSELTLANFESVVGALPVYADVEGQTTWVCHKSFYYNVMVRLALAAGGVTSVEIAGGRRVPVFLGYPVQFCQKYPSTAANSQIPVTFGNHRLAAMFGDRRMEEISFSDQASVGGESLWERDQIGVRGTERFDIVVHSYGSNSEAGPVTALEMAAS